GSSAAAACVPPLLDPRRGARMHTQSTEWPQGFRLPARAAVSNRRAVLSTLYPLHLENSGLKSNRKARLAATHPGVCKTCLFPTTSYLTERRVILRSYARGGCTGLRNTPTTGLLRWPPPIARGPRPPWHPVDFADSVAFEQAISSFGILSRLGFWQKAAESHSRQTRSVVEMGNIGRSHFPDNHANPGKRRADQVNDGPQHKNVERAVPVVQQNKNHAQQAVRDAQQRPGQQARDQQVARAAVKPQHRKTR